MKSSKWVFSRRANEAYLPAVVADERQALRSPDEHKGNRSDVEHHFLQLNKGEHVESILLWKQEKYLLLGNLAIELDKREPDKAHKR